MAIIADYIIITRPRFRMQVGAPGPDPWPSRSFTFTFPAGVALNRGLPILHYTMVSAHPGTGSQIGIAVEINGTEVHRQMFIEGIRNVLVEDVLGDANNTGAPFNATGQNTIRFLPVSLTNDHTHVITFNNVVLWFQRDSASQG